ncbi:MAG: hypothetical protein HY660_15270 [Armatimonadetes bacterium]|nr:hypothetical protein [Armatimonadota bacterium]
MIAMRRISVAVFVILSLLALVLVPSREVMAQQFPTSRTALTLSSAGLNWGAVYSLGFSVPVAEALDLVGSYHYQSPTGGTNSLYSVGLRYHIPMLSSEYDLFVGAGYTGVSLGVVTGSFPLTTLRGNASGGSVSAGGSVRLAEAWVGYASASLVSLSGTSGGVYDVGVQYRLAPQVALQAGYINFGGVGGGYGGITVAWR